MRDSASPGVSAERAGEGHLSVSSRRERARRAAGRHSVTDELAVLEIVPRGVVLLAAGAPAGRLADRRDAESEHAVPPIEHQRARPGVDVRRVAVARLLEIGPAMHEEPHLPVAAHAAQKHRCIGQDEIVHDGFDAVASHRRLEDAGVRQIGLFVLEGRVVEPDRSPVGEDAETELAEVLASVDVRPEEALDLAPPRRRWRGASRCRARPRAGAGRRSGRRAADLDCSRVSELR